MTKRYDVAVIGGGAAGLMAAGRAAELGASVVLIEKNEKLGKKIYITGKGRCNVTNLCPPEEFLKNIQRNPRFLYSSIYGFDSAALIERLSDAGLATVVERGNRVFPASYKASDVTRVLERILTKNAVHIMLNTKAESLILGESAVSGVMTDRGPVHAGAVIIATGGLAYPSTGSTGDGYRFARDTGHSVSETYPSLVPLQSHESWLPPLQGLSLRNVALYAYRGGKKLFGEQGEMLFAHFGITGPLVLTLSAVTAGTDMKDTDVFIDFKPSLSQETLEARIIRDVAASGAKQIQSLLSGLLPSALVPVFMERLGFGKGMKANALDREKRAALISLLKHFSIKIEGPRPFTEAVVTCGGVSVKDIDPKTMESKKVKGLYFAGELIDVDGNTGGFNLQIAFSTGYAAGSAAAAAGGK